MFNKLFFVKHLREHRPKFLRCLLWVSNSKLRLVERLLTLCHRLRGTQFLGEGYGETGGLLGFVPLCGQFSMGWGGTEVLFGLWGGQSEWVCWGFSSWELRSMWMRFFVFFLGFGGFLMQNQLFVFQWIRISCWAWTQ